GGQQGGLILRSRDPVRGQAGHAGGLVKDYLQEQRDFRRTDRVTWGQIPSRDSPAFSLIGWLEIPGQLAVHVRRLETIEIVLNGIPVPASGRVQPFSCIQLIPYSPPDENAPRLLHIVTDFSLHSHTFS